MDGLPTVIEAEAHGNGITASFISIAQWQRKVS